MTPRLWISINPEGSAVLARSWNLELLTDGEHRPAFDLAMPGHGGRSAVLHPNVMGCAVPKEPGVMLPEPALKCTPTHSVRMLTAAIPGSGSEATKQVVQRFYDLAQGLDDPRLHNGRDSLGSCWLVREIVQGVKNVRPGFVFRPTLGDRGGKLGDLGGNPAIVVPRIEDREARRISSTGDWLSRCAHKDQAINRPKSLRAKRLHIRCWLSIVPAAW